MTNPAKTPPQPPNLIAGVNDDIHRQRAFQLYNKSKSQRELSEASLYRKPPTWEKSTDLSLGKLIEQGVEALENSGPSSILPDPKAIAQLAGKVKSQTPKVEPQEKKKSTPSSPVSWKTCAVLIYVQLPKAVRRRE
ncbi:hypothetical protein LTS18_011047 [Coniosporium uncinatum]|uniref:Uncharacterized protein n=1 Tax=Coniosporium uncinatum TaxID=93489 RepID=A0ACC3CYV5_9PEZI|nr:hypothetical protein LTS18_011047 [Coniosporium uncinatum]